jgi:hypothetical protein
VFRKKNRSIIISYIALRRLIGILGMLLPFICILGGLLFAALYVEPSISDYYYTNMRDFFVGLLFGVSLFLITYKGYELIDDIVTNTSALAGFGIAIFPCLQSSSSTAPVGIFQLSPQLSNIIHLSCAAVFFTLLAINSIFLFTLSKNKNAAPTKNKKKRNIVYITCGIVILASIAILVVLLILFPHDEIDKYRLVLIFETIMLLAFGVSWLVKGETLFRDKPRIL